MDLEDLGDLQIKILEMLWEQGSATAGDLCDAWPHPDAPAYTTVLSVLQKLYRRKVVTRRKHGRSHIYRPKVEKEAFRSRYIGSIRQKVFGGSASGLVQALLGSEEISPTEIEEIKELLRQGNSSKNKGARS